MFVYSSSETVLSKYDPLLLGSGDTDPADLASLLSHLSDTCLKYIAGSLIFGEGELKIANLADMNLVSALKMYPQFLNVCTNCNVPTSSITFFK